MSAAIRMSFLDDYSTSSDCSTFDHDVMFYAPWHMLDSINKPRRDGLQLRPLHQPYFCRLCQSSLHSGVNCMGHVQLNAFSEDSFATMNQWLDFATQLLVDIRNRYTASVTDDAIPFSSDWDYKIYGIFYSNQPFITAMVVMVGIVWHRWDCDIVNGVYLKRLVNMPFQGDLHFWISLALHGASSIYTIGSLRWLICSLLSWRSNPPSVPHV